MIPAAAPDRCDCAECCGLDRAHPREGYQLRLIDGGSSLGDRAATPRPDPDAPAIPAAGASAAISRSRDERSRHQDPGTGDPQAMTQTKAAAKPRKSQKTQDITTRVVPSAPQIVPLHQLQRAPENVRHTRVDEDVAGLADDIIAHGLLQSLIGYKDRDMVHIVGGGRRLQALRFIEDAGLIDRTFPVPVLIRDAAEAVELSLAENLQQRTMSPVDEFFAFKALMDTGTHSPAGLAKRFGFSERVVKQRLRLADLAPPILDALAAREITIDAAMAYASSQDTDLQAEVFKIEKKRNWDAHRTSNIRHGLSMKGMRTDNPVFTFVSAARYEAMGGGYEDDLFNEKDAEKIVASPMMAQELAGAKIEHRMPSMLMDARRRADLAPSIDGYVVSPNLRIQSWGNADAKAPPGMVRVEKYAHEPLWRRIRDTGVSVHVLVGIDNDGALVIYPGIVFVAKEQRNTIDPQVVPAPAASASADAIRHQADWEREDGIERWARRLAIGPFAGTPLDGRAYWPNGEDDYDETHAATIDGVEGVLVHVNVFVTNDQVAASKEEAEQRYAEEAAEREARAAIEHAAADRETALLAMEPPAVVIVDGAPWIRDGEGAYASEYDPGEGYASWSALLDSHQPDDIDATYATRDAFDQAIAAIDPALTASAEAGA